MNQTSVSVGRQARIGSLSYDPRRTIFFSRHSRLIVTVDKGMTTGLAAWSWPCPNSRFLAKYARSIDLVMKTKRIHFSVGRSRVEAVTPIV